MVKWYKDLKKLMKVINMDLKPYDPEWKELYQKEKGLLKNVVKDEVLDIQHIGSTAVSAIQSKPIIDVAVLLRSFPAEQLILDQLESFGYKYSEERSSSERQFFTQGDPVEYHLSLVNPKTTLLQRLVAFRDYLNEHLEIAKEYEDLKKDLINKYPSGKGEYSHGKSEFVSKVLEKI
jgi:GrpB-like predicted nucleotidyltransferase (UPF0157 family)